MKYCEGTDYSNTAWHKRKVFCKEKEGTEYKGISEIFFFLFLRDVKECFGETIFQF